MDAAGWGPRGTRVPPGSGGESCAVPKVAAPRDEQTAGEQNVLNTPRLKIMKCNRI